MTKKIPLPNISNPYHEVQGVGAFIKLNHSSRAGAAELASRLQSFWYTLGYKGAKFWVKEYAKRHLIYSNLVDGVPPVRRGGG